MRTDRRAWIRARSPGGLGTVAAILAVLTVSAAGAESRRAPSAPSEQQARNAPSEQSDPWAVLRPLVGWWEGSVDGRLGTGRAVRRYEFVVGDNYLLSRHSSVRPPQEKSPQGDQHEEMGIFSFDRRRQKLIYREFMIEGVVPRSVCETEVDKIVCTTEAVESGPGIRARLTLHIVDPYRFVERYELAFPGEELQPYVEIQWTRKPVVDIWN